MKKTIRRLFILLPLTVFSAYLLFNLSKLAIEYVSMRQELNQVNRYLEDEKQVQSDLKNQIDKLNNPEYLESYAKENYLYVKDGNLSITLPNEEDEEDDK